MNASELFYQKFYHLSETQTNKVLADLILSNSAYYPERHKTMITLALEIALNQIYTEDTQRLEALMQSILEDKSYEYDNINMDLPFWDLYG